MKKLFFIFIFISCFATAIAETGYRGHLWYSKYDTFPESGQEINNLSYDSTIPLIYKKTILESKTFLFYDINCTTGELESAGYLIPKNKTDLLKKELKQKKSMVIKMDFSEYDYETGETQVENNFYIFASLAYITKNALENITDQDKEDLKTFKNAAGRITIYDYNDDTRCYVFENATPDYTVVIYVPHEQEY
jgi:hypothetical protein